MHEFLLRALHLWPRVRTGVGEAHRNGGDMQAIHLDINLPSLASGRPLLQQGMQYSTQSQWFTYDISADTCGFRYRHSKGCTWKVSWEYSPPRDRILILLCRSKSTQREQNPSLFSDAELTAMDTGRAQIVLCSESTQQDRWTTGNSLPDRGSHLMNSFNLILLFETE